MEQADLAQSGRAPTTQHAEPQRRSLPQSAAQRWLYSLKPASWPKLLVPMLFGQALAYASAGRWSLLAFVFGALFTVFGLAFIVLLNDWSDKRVDAIKRKMFPSAGSPKTIADGILSADRVARAGLLCGVLAVFTAWLAERVLMRPWATEMGVASMLLFVAYSLPPLRLNYRGGGELLEMLGVGVALPYYNAYLQVGFLDRPWSLLLVGLGFLALASAIASGLSDEVSDREGGKRTFVTMFGNHSARRATEASAVFALGAWIAIAFLYRSQIAWWALLPGWLAVAWSVFALRAKSDLAITNAFAAQGAYKRVLHRATWHATLLVGLGLILHAWL